MSLHPHLDRIPRDPLLKILFGAIAYRLLLWLPGDLTPQWVYEWGGWYAHRGDEPVLPTLSVSAPGGSLVLTQAGRPEGLPVRVDCQYGAHHVTVFLSDIQMSVLADFVARRAGGAA